MINSVVPLIDAVYKMLSVNPDLTCGQLVRALQPNYEKTLDRRTVFHHMRKFKNLPYYVNHSSKLYPGTVAQIYFVAFAGIGRIKVGWSTNAASRIKNIAVVLGDEATILGVLTGTRYQEREYHKMLREWHVKNEWFILCDESLVKVSKILVDNEH